MKINKTNKPRISASKGIKLCEEMLFKGDGREAILQNITKSYKISVGAIDKWIRAAKPNVETRQKEAEEIRVSEMEAAHREALQKGLKSDLELEVFLCQIVLGDVSIADIVKGKQVLRDVSPAERIRAIEVLYKKRGSFAPDKTANTDVEGNNILQVPLLSDKQFNKLIRTIHEASTG